MKNKIELKKILIIVSLIIMLFLVTFLILNIYEYHSYNLNFNQKINSIVEILKKKYPLITDEEIIEIINSEEKESNLLKKYGFYLEKDIVIIKNNHKFLKHLIINSLFLLSSLIIILVIFIKYNQKKDREITEIINLIKEINKKNYSLDLNSFSEDELSILKSEIYKTTIMLKENAENSLKDKEDLKKSLEDISHQIKTPLTSILIILDDLIDNPDMDNNTRLDFIRDLKREIGSINFLVQALLKLSKFEANTINFIEEKVLINDIIVNAIKNVSALSDLKNIEVLVKNNEKIYLKCDFKWQVEALTNIVKNAIDHSKENSKVVIDYKENNVYKEITVTNYGKPISKHDLNHIFERFYKGENANQESIGIGLALSKAIVESNNGKISVISDNKETKFIIKYFK